MRNIEGRSIGIGGAFEVYEGVKQQLLTITRGRLPQQGDTLGTVEGFYYDSESNLLKPHNLIPPSDKVGIINVLNAFGTPTCDRCVHIVDVLAAKHPAIPIASVDLLPKEGSEVKSRPNRSKSHLSVSIGLETAKDLGVALERGEGADEFWETALRRSLFVLKGAEILYVEQPDDQDQEPNYEAAYKIALNNL